MFLGTAAVAAGVIPETEYGVASSVLLPAEPLDLQVMVFMLLRLALAGVVGALLALHPMRRRAAGKGKRARRIIQTQIILTVAAALMVIVISDSFERAMGLVGLGSFIRFRNVVSNPVETALIFVHIGLGMACGLGQFTIVFVGTIAFAVVLVPVLYWDPVAVRGRNGGEAGAGIGDSTVVVVTLELMSNDVPGLRGFVDTLVDEAAAVEVLSAREDYREGRLETQLRFQSNQEMRSWVRDFGERLRGRAERFDWRLENAE
jgi:hypothetical protein